MCVTQPPQPLGSGQLEFEEFLALCARFLVEEDAEAMQEELREAFRLYDKEGNGYIKTTDLREILRALDDKLTEDELDEMIAEIDTDGSGTVDFDGKRLDTHLLSFFLFKGVIQFPPFRIHGNDDRRLKLDHTLSETNEQEGGRERALSQFNTDAILAFGCGIKTNFGKNV